MSVRKLLKKYQKIAKTHEMVIVHQVVNDLYHLVRDYDLRNAKRKGIEGGSE